jgi:hypothetical protein
MKNYLFIKLPTILTVLLFIFLPFVVSSTGASNQQTVPSNVSIDFQIKNPLKGGANSISGILVIILENIVMPLASVAVVLAIIYSGFKFITADGNPAKINEARTGLLYVLIGAGVLLGAKGIAVAIEATFKQLVNY